MSNWLSKSNVSFQIANNESESLFYNNRVHCQYYGCVQYMYHLMHTVFGLKVTEISDLSNSKLNPGNGGSHVWLSNYFVTDLRNKAHVFDSLDLNNHLGKLKKLRTIADYDHDDVEEDDLTNAYDLSQKIQRILNKRYQHE